VFISVVFILVLLTPLVGCWQLSDRKTDAVRN